MSRLVGNALALAITPDQRRELSRRAGSVPDRQLAAELGLCRQTVMRFRLRWSRPSNKAVKRSAPARIGPWLAEQQAPVGLVAISAALGISPEHARRLMRTAEREGSATRLRRTPALWAPPGAVMVPVPRQAMVNRVQTFLLEQHEPATLRMVAAGLGIAPSTARCALKLAEHAGLALRLQQVPALWAAS